VNVMAGRNLRRAAPGSPAVADLHPEAALDLESTGGAEQEVDSEQGLPCLPGKNPHQCTDCACGIIFLFLCAGLFPLGHYAQQNANFSKFSRGFDYQGRLCGRDECENGVTCGNLLFYCRSPDGHFDFDHPVCKSECPSGNLTYTNCVNGTTGTEVPLQGYPTIPLPDYATMLYNSKCLGFELENGHKNVAPKFVVHMAGVGWTGQAFDILQDIIDVKSTFSVTIASCMVFGYMYLYFLKLFVRLILYTSVVLMIVLPIAAGGWETWNMYSEGFTAVLQTPLGQQRLLVILGLFVAGGVFAKVYCSMRHGFDTAAAVLEASCECIWDMRSLLLQPALQLTGNCLILLPCSVLCFALATTGRIVRENGSEGQYRSI